MDLQNWAQQTLLKLPLFCSVLWWYNCQTGRVFNILNILTPPLTSCGKTFCWCENKQNFQNSNKTSPLHESDNAHCYLTWWYLSGQLSQGLTGALHITDTGSTLATGAGEEEGELLLEHSHTRDQDCDVVMLTSQLSTQNWSCSGEWEPPVMISVHQSSSSPQDSGLQSPSLIITGQSCKQWHTAQLYTAAARNCWRVVFACQFQSSVCHRIRWCRLVQACVCKWIINPSWPPVSECPGGDHDRTRWLTLAGAAPERPGLPPHTTHTPPHSYFESENL